MVFLPEKKGASQNWNPSIITPNRGSICTYRARARIALRIGLESAAKTETALHITLTMIPIIAGVTMSKLDIALPYSPILLRRLC